MDSANIKEVVREKYGQAALRVTSGGNSCCGATADSGLGCDPITANLYNNSQAQQVPEEALLASDVAILPHWRRSTRETWSWILAQAGALMSCFQPGAWDRRGRPTASI